MDIWERNHDDIEKAVQEKGFDSIVIAPANIPLPEVAEKMKMENGYYEGNNFKSGGSFAGAKSIGVDKPRIILTHKTQNLKDRPEFKATLGVKAQDIGIDEALSLEDYLYLQRAYFKETGKHLDEDDWTWTLKTKSGALFVVSCWSPSYSQLFVDADVAGGSNPALGCRVSRYFI